jgi:hypothetical protein
LEQLGRSPFPVIDRASLEQLLHLSRRQAIRLMHRFGASQAGRTFIISRESLITQLHTVRDSGTYGRQAQRARRLTDHLNEARRTLPGRRVQIPAAPNVKDHEMKDLPAGIHLRPGELRIEFSQPDDLLRQLYELSQAILNDYARFQAALEDAPPHSP